MLKIGVTEYNEKINEVVSGFPAQTLMVSEELVGDLVRTAKVDVAFVKESQEAVKRHQRRIACSVGGWIVVVATGIGEEKKVLLEDLMVRLETTFVAERKFVLRMVADAGNADKIRELLVTAHFADLFEVASGELVRFETIAETTAYYDILAQLREAGARQISLIPIEKYY